ncbi:MAG: hypothetical protein ACQEVA_03915 [Myxococcota bacterium]
MPDDEEGQGVIFTSLNLPLSPGAYSTAVRQVLLDPATGETLQCLETPEPYAITSPKFIYDTSRGTYYYAYHTDLGEGQSPSEETPRVSGSLGIELASGEAVLHEETEVYDDLRGGEKDVALFDHGEQLVVLPDDRSMVSRDTTTGDIVWTVDGPVLGYAADEVVFSGISTPAPDRLFLRLSAGGRSLVYEVDSSGQTTERVNVQLEPDTRNIFGPMLLGEQAVFQFGDDTVVLKNWQGDIAHREDDCAHAVTLDENSLACLSTDTPRRIVAFDLDGANRRVATVSADPPDGAVYTPGAWLVAAEGGYVATSSVYTPVDGPSVLNVHLFDMHQPEKDPLTASMEEPDFAFGFSASTPALLTPDGMLVISRWGSLFGVQTPVQGLATGPYPRGTSLGGNQNGGFHQSQPSD